MPADSSDPIARAAPGATVPAEVAPRASLARVLRWTGVVGAAAAAFFMWLDNRAGWLDSQPGGTAFFTYVRPVFVALLVVGAAIALRWEFAGGVIAAFAAGAIGAFAVNQLVGWHSTLVIALLAVPAAIWVLADLVGRSRKHVALGLAGVALAAGSGAAVGEYVYERQFGPTHGESDAVALPESALRWIWSGGVTADAVAVRARTHDEDAAVRLAITPGLDFTGARFVETSRRDGPIVAFEVGGLDPSTTYRYAVEVNGRLDTTRVGAVTTFPEGPASFAFTIGSDARVGSNGAVFDAIAAEDPLLHLIAGDFHYGDIRDDDRERYDEVIDLTLRQPGQAALYRSVPIAYVWDDHDYGVNDSNAFSTSRVAAMQAYRSNVPSYDLAGELSAIYQSFDAGRVRFLVTDARSAREPGVTMLGEQQLVWFLDELVVAAEEQALVVWVNPVPWVTDEDEGADDWGGYADERRRISDVIAANEIDNLLMVSGDAHMVAIDDGTNTDYSTVGGAGFPLIHAAALDRRGSTKGGPYSHGAIGGGGQYAVVDIDDDGDVVTVRLQAKNHDDEVLLAYEFTVGA